VRELESQTLQLIDEKKSLENNLEEMKSAVLEPATAAAPVAVQPDVDQVYIWRHQNFKITNKSSICLIMN